MAGALTAAAMPRDPIALARLHGMLRFSVGITAAFVLSEAMGWFPTFIPPVLVGVLLVNLPFAPPLKLGVVLVVVMAISALLALALPSLLGETPLILFGTISLIMFVAFAAIAQRKAQLPALLLLICMATVPIVALTYPAQAGILPTALVRAVLVAIGVIWCVHALWPCLLPPAPRAPPAPVESPVPTALLGTAVVMPVMLAYLMFGLTDALPVMVTTVLLVSNMELRRSAANGRAMMLGNLIGGLVGMSAYILLQIAPSLIVLALILFIMGLAFGVRLEKGAVEAETDLIAFNTSMIILSSSIQAGAAGSGLWITRLSQFAFACMFAIGMMSLVWRSRPATAHLTDASE